ncbi:SCO3933 family regulatory protein [Sphaerisporangium sp. NPDC004334]
MRTIPIPVDTNRLQFTCVKAARPRLVNKDTGEIKRDKNGNIVYEVTVSVEDDFGRLELLKIGTSAEPDITAGDEVTPVNLIGYVWEQSIQGVMRWGIAYKATDFVRTTPGMPEQVA